MATKEVTERRLRPLYDSIDNGQFKKAIQLADKLLKKRQDQTCAKALKALALHRMGKEDEGQSVAAEVQRQHPTDDATLQAMTTYYKDTFQFEAICDLYEGANKNLPKNEEIMTHLFMAYVRVRDYKQQQKLALGLHKAIPNNPYYFWGVMSIVMQGYQDPTMEQTMYLPLAEKMVQRFISEKKIDAEAELKLYLLILERMGKRQEMLKVLKEDLGRHIHDPVEKDNLELEAMMKCDMWTDATQKLTRLLHTFPDQWSYIKDYISCQIRNHQLNSESSALRVAKETFDGLLATQQKEDSKPRVRGPFLAPLEFLCQLREADLDGNIEIDPVENILVYFREFGGKPCCFDDLHIFLSVLSKDQIREMLKCMTAIVEENPIDYDCKEEDLRTNLAKMQRHINVLQLERFCGLPLKMTGEEKAKYIQDMKQFYQKGLQLGGKGSNMEVQLATPYILLAILVAMEAAQDTSKLWDIVLELEVASQKNKHNSQLSLLLLKLYATLGAFELCADLYDQLDIKHIQVDTIGYLPRRYMMACGTFALANNFLTFGLQFYFNTQKEMGEFIIQAYKNGSFPKIIEMVEMRERILSSFLFATLQVQNQLLQVVRSISDLATLRRLSKQFFRTKFEDDITIAASKLCDNRDLALFEDWNPPSHQLTEETIRMSFEVECLHFQVFAYLIKCLQCSLDTPTEGGAEENASDRENPLSGTLTGLETVLVEARRHPMINVKFPMKITSLPVNRPPVSEIVIFIANNYDKAFLNILRSLELLKGPKELSEMEYDVKEHLEAAIQVLRDVVIVGLSDKDLAILNEAVDTDRLYHDRKHPFHILKHVSMDTKALSMFTQVVSLIVLFCELLMECLLKRISSLPKKQKKKTKIPNQSVCINHLVWFISELQSLVMSHLPRNMYPKISNLSLLMKKLSLTDEVTDVGLTIYENVAESYNTSFKECRSVLKEKLNSLTQLLKRLGASGSILE